MGGWIGRGGFRLAASGWCGCAACSKKSREKELLQGGGCLRALHLDSRRRCRCFRLVSSTKQREARQDEAKRQSEVGGEGGGGKGEVEGGEEKKRV